MNQKIIAKARFVPQNKTLAEWEAENPILLIGEHGVANDGVGIKREKIGDGITPWNELDWWKGESAYEIAVRNGFIGTETEWLEGLKGKDATIDQTYNSESENAQSGVAIAEAVTGRIPKPVTETESPYPRVLVLTNPQGYEQDNIPDSAFSYVYIDSFGHQFLRGLIPVRNEDGNLETETPKSSYDCTNKEYVDSLVGNIETLLGGI